MLSWRMTPSGSTAAAAGRFLFFPQHFLSLSPACKIVSAAGRKQAWVSKQQDGKEASKEGKG